jgi:pilus assembly protein TadC
MASRKRWWIGTIAGFAVIWFTWDISPLVVILGPVAAIVAWVVLGRLEPAGARARKLQLLQALPGALDLLRAAMRAGQPMRVAILTVAEAVGEPIAERFGTVSQAISVGMFETQAWQVLADDPILAPVARDMARCATWGTSVTDVLAGHSRDLRRQIATETLAAAKAIGVKAVLPLGVCYLPAFMLLGVVPLVASGLVGIF